VNKITSLLPIKNQKEENKLTFTSNPNPKLRRKTMSNINNHGVDMKNDAPFQELSCEKAATIQGGASAQVFTDANFSGLASFPFSGDIALFDLNNFNDKISSIKVFSGQWTFWSDSNFSGSGIVLGPGEYSDLSQVNGGVYNDVISSAKVNIQ
jgi:Beta/Gamma crystallin